jgi:Dolichyl-phosphate-mannose-protein mannosyltransferase
MRPKRAHNNMRRRYLLVHPLLWLGLTTLLAFALRVVRLDFQPLWWDEGYSVFFATRDVPTMLSRTAVDIHPPLYYALLQAWILLVGKSDVGLRLFSVGIGVAAIPLMYSFVSKLFNMRTGLIAAVVLSLSPLHVYYSQEVRMYGLVALLALMSMTLQMALLNSSRVHKWGFSEAAGAMNGGAHGARGRRYVKTQWVDMVRARETWLWVSYILVTSAALYVEYYAAFLLVAELAVAVYWTVVLRRRLQPDQPLSSEGPGPEHSVRGADASHRVKDRLGGWTALRQWVLACLAIIVVYLAWLIYAGPKLYAYVGAKVGIEEYSQLDPLTFLVQHLTAFSIGHVSDFTWLAWSSILFVGLGLFGIVSASHREKDRDIDTTTGISGIVKSDANHTVRILLVYLLVPLACGWLVNLVYPFHPIRYERLLLFAALPFYALVARGLAEVFTRDARLGYAAMGIVALVSTVSLYDFYTVPRYPDEDYRDLIAEMRTVARPGDVVLAPYPWQIGYLESYYAGPPLHITEVPADKWIAEPGQMESALGSIRSSGDRVWLLAYQVKGRILESEIANEYAGDYHLVDDWFRNTRLELFQQAPEPTLNEIRVNLTPTLALDSFGVGAEPVTAGESFVLVRLHWEAGSNEYSYSLRIVDPAGKSRVQQDEPINSGSEIQRLGVFVPAGVPGGAYELVMIGYVRADGSPLALPDGTKELKLGRVLVIPP